MQIKFNWLYINFYSITKKKYSIIFSTYSSGLKLKSIKLKFLLNYKTFVIDYTSSAETWNKYSITTKILIDKTRLQIHIIDYKKIQRHDKILDSLYSITFALLETCIIYLSTKVYLVEYKLLHT